MANTDLEQYDGTSSFPATADVGTSADEFLEPTDGPLISANDNGLNTAPVNKALRRCKDLLLGIRDGIFGDRPGSVLYTLRSLQVDGGGGNASTVGDGQIQAAGNVITLNDFSAPIGNARIHQEISSDIGDFVARAGSMYARMTSAAFAVLTNRSVAFIGTAATSSNPAQGTSIKNVLVAKNTPKCAAFIRMTAPGVIADFEGYGILNVTIDSTAHGQFNITFKDSFDNTRYTCTSGKVYMGGLLYDIVEAPSLRTVSTAALGVYDNTGAAVDLLTMVSVSCSVEFNGQQTT